MDNRRNRSLACDRCRAQKLKCVQLGISETCQRCATAKTTCSFRRPLPPGQTPIAWDLGQESVIEGLLPVTALFSQTESTTSVLSPGAQSVLPEQPNAGRWMMPATGNCNSVDPSFTTRAWFQIGSWEDDDLFYMMNDETNLGDIDTPTFETWSAAPTKDADDLWSWQNLLLSKNIGRHLSHMINGPASNTLVCPTPPASRRDGLIINTSPDKGPQWSPYTATPSSVSNSTELGEPSQSQSRLVLMQKLMQLGSVMYEIQTIHSCDKHGSQPVSCESFPAELVGKVLQSAINFLKSLLCFSKPVSRASSSSRAPLSSSWARAPSAESLSRRDSVTDKPTILQLIATYLLLLQLYLLMYSAVHDYVRFSESDSSRLQPIWNDLSLGCTPLYQFAEFQVKMVLQVAERLLEEIEGALGLVEGCRLTKKSANEGGGILGVNVTAQFIEMCTSEISTMTEPSGRGAVVRLQELMDSLATTLNGPVGL